MTVTFNTSTSLSPVPGLVVLTSRASELDMKPSPLSDSTEPAEPMLSCKGGDTDRLPMSRYISLRARDSSAASRGDRGPGPMVGGDSRAMSQLCRVKITGKLV